MIQLSFALCAAVWSWIHQILFWQAILWLMTPHS